MSIGEILDKASAPRGPLIGCAALMRMAMAGQDLSAVASALAKRVHGHQDDPNALLDYAVLLQLTGQPELGMLMQQRALDQQLLYSKPGGPFRLLVLMAPGELMWNTPVELLLEDAGISIDFLYLPFDQPWPETVPEHDVAFMAIAESQDNQHLLQRLNRTIASWPRPVINHPGKIAALTRDNVSAMLRDIPGLYIPPTVRVNRALLHGCSFYPFIVRPLDSHAGRDLALLPSAEHTAAYLAQVAEDDFFASPFVDYRSPDGLYRKYRVVLILGQPFLSHMAISSHWLVHYLNAGMESSRRKRLEEANTMARFEETFALRHASALRQLHERAGLEYLVIDCAELAAGELLIFEVGTAMAVHAMDSPNLYPYKQAEMQKIFRAFRAMLSTNV